MRDDFRAITAIGGAILIVIGALLLIAFLCVLLGPPRVSLTEIDAEPGSSSAPDTEEPIAGSDMFMCFGLVAAGLLVIGLLFWEPPPPRRPKGSGGLAAFLYQTRGEDPEAGRLAEWLRENRVPDPDAGKTKGR